MKTRYQTRDGRDAQFIGFRNAGNRLALFKVDNISTLRREDGSFRYDDKPSPHDIMDFKEQS